MGILIDTDVIIDYERNKTDLSGLVQEYHDQEFIISVISASELLHGVHRAKDSAIRSRRLSFVEAVLSLFPVIPIDLKTARSHAELWSHLAARGKMIGLHDSWLAATCLAHDLVLISRNARDFRRVPGLDFKVV